MPNPRKKFEIEIGVIGVWITELDQIGRRIPDRCIYLCDNDLENTINALTTQLQIDFNF